MTLRVAAVQLAPMLANVEKNTQKALSLLEKSLKTPVDLVVLPELALTGYNFHNRNHITPYLERLGQGPSYEFAKLVSERWKCVTVVGYPEIRQDTIFNSAVVVSPKGNILHNYRKTHLYETDKVWGCEESPEGFHAFDLPIERLNRIFKTSIGICMDLNPYEFKAPFEAYEFASEIVKDKVELVIVPTAWMNSSWDEHWSDSQVKAFQSCYDKPIVSLEEINLINSYPTNNRILTPPPYPFKEMGKPNHAEYLNHMRDVDAQTGRYWIMRLRPLWETKCNVIITNRSGMEDKLMYAGTSSMVSFYGGGMVKDEENRVSIDMEVRGSLGMATEGVLVRELNI